MGNNSDYIKEVEKYFLSLAGKGIMLSSMDYSLITEWKNKEIPKEVVFKGINRAFQERRDESSIRNIKQCAKFVEQSVIEYSPVMGKTLDRTQSTDLDNALSSIVEALNQIINSESSQKNKSYYIDLKQKLLYVNEDNPLSHISNIEEGALDKFFMSLDEHARDEVVEQAKKKLGRRARHMTDAAIEESIISFRNEILAGKYGLKSLLSIIEDKHEEDV
jgi:hypothetical protein